MKFSVKTDYACKALLELGINWPNSNPIQIGTIAQRQKIPIKFLTQILLNLKQAGLVQSLRGKSGGYLLARDPKEIYLKEIITCFDGIELAPVTWQKEEGHVMADLWQEITTKILQVMDTITLEAICERVQCQDQALMYEI